MDLETQEFHSEAHLQLLGDLTSSLPPYLLPPSPAAQCLAYPLYPRWATLTLHSDNLPLQQVKVGLEEQREEYHQVFQSDGAALGRTIQDTEKQGRIHSPLGLTRSPAVQMGSGDGGGRGDVRLLHDGNDRIEGP